MLFFNGWGMDEHVVAHLECDDAWDVLMACDYRDLRSANFSLHQQTKVCTPEQPLNFAGTVHNKEIVVICWSMGVWAYACVSAELKINPAHVIAINGTPQPIHAEFGIAPDVYQATLDQFDEAGREKFFKRMCGSSAMFERFNRQRPQRSLAEQAEELASIQTMQSPNSPPGRGKGWVGCLRLPPTHPQPLPGGEFIALISRHDRIMPTANQRRYWEGRARCVLLDAPHYPFFLWRRWTDILTMRTLPGF